MIYLRLLVYIVVCCFTCSLLCSVIGVSIGWMLLLVTHAVNSLYVVNPLAVGGWFCILGCLIGIGVGVYLWNDWWCS